MLCNLLEIIVGGLIGGTLAGILMIITEETYD